MRSEEVGMNATKPVLAAALAAAACACPAARAGEAAPGVPGERKEGDRVLLERILTMQRELQRRHDKIDRMHRIILTQQQALEFAKRNMENSLEQRAEALEDLKDARAELAELRKENVRLRDRIKKEERNIERLKAIGVPVDDFLRGTDAQPAQPIHGKVLAVRREVNLVMLSVGREDGVKKGYRFTIYRDQKYIGKVEIEKVFTDMSSARILRDWTKEKIREGDDAAVRFGYRPLREKPRKDKPKPPVRKEPEDAPLEEVEEVF